MLIQRNATLIKVSDAAIVEIEGEQYLVFVEPCIEHAATVEAEPIEKVPPRPLSQYEVNIFNVIKKHYAMGLEDIVAALDQEFHVKTDKQVVRLTLQELRKMDLIFCEGWGKSARWYIN